MKNDKLTFQIAFLACAGIAVVSSIIYHVSFSEGISHLDDLILAIENFQLVGVAFFTAYFWLSAPKLLVLGCVGLLIWGFSGVSMGFYLFGTIIIMVIILEIIKKKSDKQKEVETIFQEADDVSIVEPLNPEQIVEIDASIVEPLNSEQIVEIDASIVEPLNPEQIVEIDASIVEPLNSEQIVEIADKTEAYESRITEDIQKDEESPCKKCGHSYFNYSSYFNEYSCDNCGWIRKKGAKKEEK